MTNNQEKVLKILRERISWRPPTIRDMVDMTGMSDITSVVWVLKKLEQDGLIEKRGRYYYPKEPDRIQMDMSGTTLQ